MTAALPSSNPNDANPPLLRSNRSYREAASAHLAQNERLRKEQSCPPEAPCERPCGSPPRYRPSSSRCRSRSPPQPSSRDGGDECPTSKKAPRSVSPGGTAASSAGAALRGQQGQEADAQPRVSWSNTLVSSVRTRPRTLRKDVATLFYSRADEKRMRREAEFTSVEDDWSCDSLEEDVVDQPNQPPATEDHQPLWSPQRERKDYAISKAVVVFGNSTRTYGGALPTGCAIEAALEAEASSAASFSFDDAAFWNGQLTWS